MRSLRVLIALFPLVVLSFIVTAQEERIYNDLPWDSLNQSFSNILDTHTQSFPDSTQLAIALIKENKVEYIGVEKVNGTLTRARNENKVFEIGSISKVFTSTILAQMIGDGILSLDDRVGQILDLSDLDDYGVTLQHLANHTSGLLRLPTNLDLLSEPSNPYKAYDTELLIQYLSGDFELMSLPGESYAYSNLGAGLLGHILTVESGKSYEQLLQEIICKAYKLNNTTTIRSEVPQNHIVRGRQPNGDPADNWDFDVLVGAGGILSTVEDLIQFAQAQIKSNHLSHTISHNATHELDDNMAVGLGWHIIKQQNGGKWLWHNGGTAGYTSSMTIDKEHKAAVVILSNVSAFHLGMGNVDQLCFSLLTELNK